MFFQTPCPGINELEESYPERELAVTIAAPPTGFKQVTTRKYLGPTLAKEEGNDDDESSLDSN